MNILARILLTLACLFLVFVVLCLIIYHDRRPQIFHDVEEGNTNAIAKYLAAGNDVNTPILSYPSGGNRNVPLLDVALESGQSETVEFLLKNKADPNQPDYRGEVPLEWALGHYGNSIPIEKQVKILKTLIDAGADPNQKDSNQYGYTPLINAAEFGESEMVKALLFAGAAVNATNNEGMTALHFAENTNVAQVLIQAGADVNAHAGGETPAQSAVRLGHFSVLAVLTNEPAAQP